MNHRQTAVAVAALATLALAACSGTSPNATVDVRPIGDGLVFLGLAGVLAAFVIVLGPLIGGRALQLFLRYAGAILLCLFVLLAAAIAAAAAPKLVVPILFAVVTVIAVGVVLRIGR